ncbi:unnamed protein product, partial [Ectocarpus sp. 13 AM-2016]
PVVQPLPWSCRSMHPIEHLHVAAENGDGQKQSAVYRVGCLWWRCSTCSRGMVSEPWMTYRSSPRSPPSKSNVNPLSFCFDYCCDRAAQERAGCCSGLQQSGKISARRRRKVELA